MSRTVSELFDLRGRTALVTGGSRGLGFQAAEALAEAGARVCLTSRKAADLEAATAALTERGLAAEWIAGRCLECRPDSADGEHSDRRMGVIDILVNNAGATWGAPAEDYPIEAWDKVMNLNVRSAFVPESVRCEALHDRAPPRTDTDDGFRGRIWWQPPRDWKQSRTTRARQH